MARIICDPQAVTERYGFVPNDRLLFSAIRLDSFPFVTPLIFEDAGTELMLARQQEQGNIVTGGGVDPERRLPSRVERNGPTSRLPRVFRLSSRSS